MLFPTLFVSHGAPNLILHNSRARDFLAGYGRMIGRPEAVLVVSAHFETNAPTIVSDPHPEMIYDFRGFEPELSQIVYPAPGDPDLAGRASALLDKAGIKAMLVADRGFDHGAWVPLALLFPDADVPVVQVSVQPDAGPLHHMALGEALAPLREDGVLIIGSGAFTHNLQEIFKEISNPDAPESASARTFSDWARQRILDDANDDLIHYRERAPHAAENHPTEEHFMPLFVAMGAAGKGAARQHVHASHQYGAMMMDAFAFG